MPGIVKVYLTKHWRVFTLAAILSIIPVVCSWISSNSVELKGIPAAQSSYCPISYLKNAVELGAVCLDGSPPAYHFRAGWGSGAARWLVFLEGGGWCSSLTDCFQRSRTKLGSSTKMPNEILFEGILSGSSEANPDFFDWNVVFVRYCDGASFAGDVATPVHVQTSGRGREIYFRGERIWAAVIKELLELGMKEAQMALLAGCSAGGLAAQLHCKAFAAALPATAAAKCMADAGFFLDSPDIAGTYSLRALYQNVVAMQKVSLDNECVAQSTSPNRWQCFFPKILNAFSSIPLFVVQPLYDSWQVANILVPRSADPRGVWRSCRKNIAECSSSQLSTLQNYRQRVLDDLGTVLASNEDGAFLSACFVHCQTTFANTWHGPSAPRINGKTMAMAVGDWFFERSRSSLVDCQYPCNPTCSNWM